MTADVGASDVGVGDEVGPDGAVAGSEVGRSALVAGVEVQAAQATSSMIASTRNRGRGRASPATRAR